MIEHIKDEEEMETKLNEIYCKIEDTETISIIIDKALNKQFDLSNSQILTLSSILVEKTKNLKNDYTLIAQELKL